jgi:hypothetical protein
MKKTDVGNKRLGLLSLLSNKQQVRKHKCWLKVPWQRGYLAKYYTSFVYLNAQHAKYLMLSFDSEFCEVIAKYSLSAGCRNCQ